MTPTVQLQRLVLALEQAGCAPRRDGEGFRAKCPAHGGHNATALSIRDGQQAILVTCFAQGCSAEDVVQSLGLDMSALFYNERFSHAFAPTTSQARPQRLHRPASVAEQRAAFVCPVPLTERPADVPDQRHLKEGTVWFGGAWVYHDETGTPLYRVVRWNGAHLGSKGKDFRQGAYVGGRFLNAMTLPSGEPCQRVLYRLPEVRAVVQKGGTVILVEGEKCADQLGALVPASDPVVVTTAPGGAGKWKDAFAECLRGAARAIVLLDDDKSGHLHGQAVVRSLEAATLSVQCVLAPDGAHDVADWIESGGDWERLCRYLETAQSLSFATAKDLDSEGDGATSGLPGEPLPFVPSRPAAFEGRLGEAALVGLAGEIVQTLRPYTEAPDVSVLAHLLVFFGVAVGGAPAVSTGAEHHPARLFALVCGPSGKGRKGTAYNAAKAVAVKAFPDVFAHAVTTVQSGEALVRAVRDGEGDDPGVEDKRLLWFEPEFATLLSAKDRRGSQLSPKVREAWDRGDLCNNTKLHPMRATNPHIGFVGHITPEELRMRMDATDAFNGLLNRFLFVYAERERLLPNPPALPDEPIERLAFRLGRAASKARTCQSVGCSPEAQALWEAWYPGLSDHPPGLLGVLGERAAPYLLRLALVYALLDERTVIKVDDLRAARAVWVYSSASARHIFGRRTGSKLADRIVRDLSARGPMSRTQIMREVAAGNRSAADVTDALHLLYDAGLVAFEQSQTNGRPTEIWRMKHS